MLNEAGFPRPLRRIVVTVTGPESLHENSGRQFFTYRFSDGLYREERLYRGLHPMIAKRLHFWRLANFHLERLPSVEDVYLLRAVARENPKDERLIVCAEVRDLTPIRNERPRHSAPGIGARFDGGCCCHAHRSSGVPFTSGSSGTASSSTSGRR